MDHAIGKSCPKNRQNCQTYRDFILFKIPHTAHILALSVKRKVDQSSSIVYLHVFVAQSGSWLLFFFLLLLIVFEGAVSLGYCCFRSNLVWSLYLEPLSKHKMLLWSYVEDIKLRFHQGVLKLVQLFQVSITGYPSLPFVATNVRKQFQC